MTKTKPIRNQTKTKTEAVPALTNDAVRLVLRLVSGGFNFTKITYN